MTEQSIIVDLEKIDNILNVLTFELKCGMIRSVWNKSAVYYGIFKSNLLILMTDWIFEYNSRRLVGYYLTTMRKRRFYG